MGGLFKDLPQGLRRAMSLAEKLIEEFEKDPRAKKRLAELLVVEPDVRLAMINALMAEVATRRDLGELRAEMRSEMGQLRSEMGGLRSDVGSEIGQLRSEMGELRSEIGQLRIEISSNFRWTIGTILVVWGATVIPILLRLIGAI